MLAKQTWSWIVINLLIPTTTTPLGALVLGLIMEYRQVTCLPQLMGLLTAPPLYVTTSDLRPEVFHLRRRHRINLLPLIIGIVLTGIPGHLTATIGV